MEKTAIILPCSHKMQSILLYKFEYNFFIIIKQPFLMDSNGLKFHFILTCLWRSIGSGVDNGSDGKNGNFPISLCFKMQSVFYYRWKYTSLLFIWNPFLMGTDGLKFHFLPTHHWRSIGKWVGMGSDA